jgi:peptide chain release factor 1
MAQEEYEKKRARWNRSRGGDQAPAPARTHPNDSKNVIIEIRGGRGGEEAALFALWPVPHVHLYATSKRWKTEIANLNEGDRRHQGMSAS